MKKYLCSSLFFLSVICNSTIYSQEVGLLNASNPFDYIDELLKEGFYDADLMTGSVTSERQTELVQKMFSYIQNDYDWYIEFVKDSKDGFPEKYDQRLGLTEDEFHELRNLVHNYQMLSVNKFVLEISKSGGRIKFYTVKGPGGFENIQIDLIEKTVRFGQYQMLISDTLVVDNSNNRIGSKWEGIQWSYSFPEEINMDNIAEVIKDESIIKLYRLTIGELIPSSRIYISIKGVEIENGVKKGEFIFPLFLTKRK